MAETKTEQTSNEEIVSYLRERLEAVKDDTLAKIEAKEREAEQQEARYWTAREDLEEARTHLRQIREEYEGLPMRSHTARMKQQEAHEKELNERYRALDTEIPQVEDRIRSLSAELDALAPGSRRIDPEKGVPLTARTPLAKEARRHSEELESLQSEIEELLNELLGEVHDEAERIQRQVSGLSMRVEEAWRGGGYTNAGQIPSHGEES